jgi:hypothetical protein
MDRRLGQSIDQALAASQSAMALSTGILNDLSGFMECRWRL